MNTHHINFTIYIYKSQVTRMTEEQNVRMTSHYDLQCGGQPAQSGPLPPAKPTPDHPPQPRSGVGSDGRPLVAPPPAGLAQFVPIAGQLDLTHTRIRAPGL